MIDYVFLVLGRTTDARILVTAKRREEAWEIHRSILADKGAKAVILVVAADADLRAIADTVYPLNLGDKAAYSVGGG